MFLQYGLMHCTGQWQRYNFSLYNAKIAHRFHKKTKQCIILQLNLHILCFLLLDLHN